MPRPATAVLLRCAVHGLPFLLFVVGLVVFHWSETGLLPYQAGIARQYMSARQAAEFLGIPVHPVFLVRLVAYAPLTVMASIGACAALAAVLRRSEKEGGERRAVLGLLVVEFLAFFLLYSTVLSSVHLARYTIFLWPFLTILASHGLQNSFSWARPRGRGRAAYAVVAMLVVGLVVVFGIEAQMRSEAVAELGTVRSRMQDFRLREERSAELLAALGSPPGVQSIAYREVQVRWRLDDRFVIRSLDGVVDDRLLDFISDDGVDHIGYLKSRGIRWVAEYPHMNPPESTSWSLRELEDLPAGRSVLRGGVRFTRLPNGISRVDFSPNRAAPGRHR